MAEVRKFSLAYIAAEDRIAWDAEDETGATARVWLTQRFCRGFVDALIGKLPAPGPEVPSAHQATVQGWEQAAAVSGLGRTPGVTVSPQAPAGLVRAAHITPTRSGVTIDFEFGADERRAVTLTAAGVRQMLSIIHDLHVAAGWPTDFWPEWIAKPAATGAVALN